MPRTVVKRVRLTEKEAKQLALIAKRRNTTESEVLREALQHEARLLSRRQAVDQLVRWAELEVDDWTKPEVVVKW